MPLKSIIAVLVLAFAVEVGAQVSSSSIAVDPQGTAHTPRLIATVVDANRDRRGNQPPATGSIPAEGSRSAANAPEVMSGARPAAQPLGTVREQTAVAATPSASSMRQPSSAGADTRPRAHALTLQEDVRSRSPAATAPWIGNAAIPAMLGLGLIALLLLRKRTGSEADHSGI